MHPSSPQSTQCVNRARVSVPQGVAYDMQAIDEVVTTCLNVMRCPACASGRVMEFATLQDVVGVRMQVMGECVA